MPNWCYVNVDINCSSKKQAKKIYDLLVEDEHEYDFDDKYVDYSLLARIDDLNMRLADTNIFEAIFEEECKKYDITSEDLIKIGYYISTNRRPNSSYLYSNDYKDIIKYVVETNKLMDTVTDEESDKLHCDRLIGNVNLNQYRTHLLENRKDDMDKAKYKYSNKTGIMSIDDWYFTRLERIGTKWNPTITYSEIIDNVISLSLECAWGPCEAFFKYLSVLFVCNIELEYEEFGMGFIGKSLIVDGQINEVYYFDHGSELELIMCRDDVEKENHDYEYIRDQIVEVYEIEIDELDRHKFKETMKDEFEMSDDHIKSLANKFYPKRKIRLKKTS